MAILANRIKTTSHLLELGKFVFFSLKRFSVIVLICTCCYLLYFPIQIISKSSLEVSGSLISIGSFVSDTMIDSVKLIYDRLSYFRNLEAENITLKLKLSQLSKTELLARNLLSENKELRKLLQVTGGVKNDSITSRLVGMNITPFASFAIVEAGSDDNITVDSLVTNQDGLIGRITDVSNHYASVMLLGDPNSRIPIITSNSKERGLLTSQGSEVQLIYLPENHNITAGELVYTSGDGKIYPYGLMIGRVEHVSNKGVFVTLSANPNNAEFVNIELKSPR